MATEFISNSWLMPENSNQDKLTNYSLDFDAGSSQKIDAVVSALDNATALTFAGWFKKTSGNVIGFESFNSVTDRAILYWWSDNNVYWSIRNGASSSAASSSLTTYNWNHIVGTFDGSTNTIKLYINGSLVDTQTGQPSSTSANLSNNFHIGLSNGSTYNEGNLTEISIFDYALTDGTGGTTNQIGELYGTGSAIGNPMSLTTKPVAYYPLGDAAFNGEFLATNNATELYENYSLAFNGTDDRIDIPQIDITGDKSVSFWIKRDSSAPSDDGGIFTMAPASGTTDFLHIGFWQNTIQAQVSTSASTKKNVSPGGQISVDTWYHIVLIKSNNSIDNIYINGVNKTLIATGSWTGSIATPQSKIGETTFGATDHNFFGKINNFSIYNSQLSAAQVTTLYNSGKPFDLNTFAVTPTNWWKLGASGSSFDGTNWTVLDEVGTSNGTSANMTQADLVDGVGATGNGVSSGMSSGTNKVGNSPYSDNNSVSYNMSVTAESTSVPT